jgi:Protein of unknown function (DUF3105)
VNRQVALWLFGGSGVVALGAVIAVIFLVTGGKSTAAKTSGVGSAAGVDATMRAAGCTLQTARATSRRHVTSLQAKIKYNTTPPSNGSHYYSPAIWGFYNTPADPIQVVHNEEHGGVILWWGSKVPQSTIAQLHDFYNSSPNAMFGTPYPKLGSKIAISAWPAPSGGMGKGHVAVCSTFDRSAFTAFRDAFRGKGPERFPVDILTPGT